MVMPGSKAYDVQCLTCGWKKMVTVRSAGANFGLLDKMKLPSKCPKCGGKVSIKENKTIWF